MGALQVKRVPDDIHDELRRRAHQEGMTVRDYVLDLIRRDQAMPSRLDWIGSLSRLRPIRTDRSAADLIREQRASRGGG